ncbi:hypothetical protein cyc_08762 [Cyclospora cayetanensis]|uniref:Uncharacterized protein n=1 Tax=Cyclospora cayetanensis TaxID=88456 RepID=A0A1D3CZH5_9EIME|nr:hypothetical protein cyc_08762 [Cyclospora cayetanensis]
MPPLSLKASNVAAYSQQLKDLQQQSEVLGTRLNAPEGIAAVDGLEPRELDCVSSRLIGECNATALQTEGLGLHIMQHLRTQRDTIFKTNRLAEATGAEGLRGYQAIAQMIKRHWLNRVVLTATIILLALCILMVLLHKSKLSRFLFT